MAKKTHLNPQKWITWLKEWQASRDEDADLATLEATLVDTSADAFAIALAMRPIPTYFAVRGSIELWEGNPRGWDEIVAYWTLAASSLAIFIHRLDRALSERGGKYLAGKMGVSQLRWTHMNAAALLLATADVFQRTEFSTWLAKRVETSIISADNLVGKPAWTETDFERNMFKLHAVGAGMSLQEANSIYGVGGVFQELLDAWHDDKTFAVALSKCCDFHLENCRKDEHVFALLPFVYFPAEILAVLQYREQLGLTTDGLTHPLLQTPFASCPRSLPRLDSKHLAMRIIAQCATECPILNTIL